MTEKSRFIILISAIALGVLFFHGAARWNRDFVPADAALGKDTFSTSGTYQDRTVSYIGSGLSAVIKTAVEARKQGHQVVVIFGASQLHAINQTRAGDRLAVVHANERAAARKAPITYVQLTWPGATFYHMTAFYLAARSMGFVPDAVVLGVFFNAMRQEYVADELLVQMPEPGASVIKTGGPGLVELAKLKHGQLQRAQKGSEVLSGPEEASGALAHDATSGTPQEKLEEIITSAMEKNWSAYAVRGKLEARIEFLIDYFTNHYLKAQVKRRAADMPAAAKNWNLLGFDSLIALTKADNVETFVYEQPHPPNESVFYYDRADYDSFYAGLKSKCENGDCRFRDLSGIVPAELWGKDIGGLPDVAHFQGKAHEILGHAIDAFVEEFVTQKSQSLRRARAL